MKEIEKYLELRTKLLRNSSQDKRTKWVDASERLPRISGMYYVKFNEYPGEINVAEFYKSKKTQHWSCMYNPTHWSEPLPEW